MDRNIKPVDTQKEYPLYAFLRIYKSDKMEIQRITSKEACIHLVDAVFEVDIQRNQKDLIVIKEWFALIADMAKKNEGWHLTFKKDAGIIQLVYEMFEKKDVF